jgi:hypothetical protein
VTSGENYGDSEAEDANFQPKLDELRRRIEGKSSATVRLNKAIRGTSTLSDEDVAVVTIELQVPSSALLGSVKMDRPASEAAGHPDVLRADSDPTDPIQIDGDPGPIADADGVDLVHTLPAE